MCVASEDWLINELSDSLMKDVSVDDGYYGKFANTVMENYVKSKTAKRIVVKRSELISLVSMPVDEALRRLAERIAPDFEDRVAVEYILRGVYHSIRRSVEEKLPQVIEKLSKMYQVEIEPTEEYKDKLALLLLALALLGDLY